jgi:putative transposase
MPRKPRFFLPNVPVHIMIRGNSRQVVFAEDEDYFAYRGWLREASELYDCNIHAYVMMTNHVHILVSAEETTNISRLSQAVGRKYVPYFNHKYGKSGTLWEGRFKASSVESEYYLLACYRYIELNPVRAGMVERCDEYAWSSYHANANGQKDLMIAPHPVYLRLGRTKSQRQMGYRALFKDRLSDSLISEIQQTTQTGTPLGSDKFRKNIEELLGVKTGYAKRGRPAKK